VPVPGFVRHTVNDYFFPTKPIRAADLVKARPLWVLDRRLMNALDAITDIDGESQTLIDFPINKSGAITRLRSNSRVGKALIRNFFKPMRTRLKFAPATRAGEPIRSELTLRLASNSHSPFLETNDSTSRNPHSMPRYPKGEVLDHPIEVIATVDFGVDGRVATARVDENAPEKFAIELIKAIRTWQYRADHRNLPQHP